MRSEAQEQAHSARVAAGKALVATEAAHEREGEEDDATGSEQNTLSDRELDSMELGDARQLRTQERARTERAPNARPNPRQRRRAGRARLDALAAQAADALAEAKRLKQAKSANDRRTKKHVSLQRRRPQEQARTEPAAERNEENQRGDRTPSRERRVRPGGQAARRPDGRAPRQDRHGSTPTPTEDEASGNEDDEPRAPEPRAKKAKKAKNR